MNELTVQASRQTRERKVRLSVAIIVLSFWTGATTSPLIGQEILPRWGAESDVLEPRTPAHRAQMTEIEEWQREVDAMPPYGDALGVVQLHEMHLAQFGREGASGCLLPVDSIAYVDPPWPADAAAGFVVRADPGASVLYFQESPRGCLGDPPITYEYYFDWEGATRMFRRTAGVVGTCPAGALREITTYFYDTSGALIAKSYTMTDGDGVEVQADACQGFRQRESYVIGKSWLIVSNLRLRGFANPPG